MVVEPQDRPKAKSGNEIPAHQNPYAGCLSDVIEPANVMFRYFPLWRNGQDLYVLQFSLLSLAANSDQMFLIQQDEPVKETRLF